MHIIKAADDCSHQLLHSVENAGCFGEAFSTFRPLSYADGCTVTRARCTASGESLVVKTYSKQRDPLALLQVLTEIEIQHSLDSPSVLPLLVAFEDTRNLYLVLEWADGGDLRDQLRRVGTMSERQCRDWIAVPVLEALSLLQEEGIAHRDLKPENVLVRNGRAVLADFGLSMYYSIATPDASDIGLSPPQPGAERAAACVKLANNAGGTAMYTAPEVLLAMFGNQSMLSVVQHKNDVWALGMMLLEALSGQHPFSPENCAHVGGNVLWAVAHHKPHQLWQYLPGTVSKEMRDFLDQALQRDPGQRPTAQQLLHHPWLETVLLPTSASAKSFGTAAAPPLIKIPSLDNRLPSGLPRAHSACAVVDGHNLVLGSESDAVSCNTSTCVEPPYQDLDSAEPSPAAVAALHDAALEQQRVERACAAFMALDSWGD